MISGSRRILSGRCSSNGVDEVAVMISPLKQQKESGVVSGRARNKSGSRVVLFGMPFPSPIGFP